MKKNNKKTPMSLNPKKTKSFTLIELLVVIAIIALLVVIIAIPTRSVIRNARIATTLQYESSLHKNLGADIVGWWQFDEGSGTIAKDISGKDNHGTIYGATYVDGVPGKGGKALSFDGNNDWIRVPNSLSLQVLTITMSAWVYTILCDGGTQGHLVRKEGSYILSSCWNGTVYAWLQFDGVAGWFPLNSNVSLEINKWSHIVATHDGNVRKIYINGKQITSSAFSGNLKVSGNSLDINGDISNSNFINYKVDDVRIYSSALTASEINEIYLTTKDKYMAEEE